VLAVLAHNQGKALLDHHLKLLRDAIVRDVLVVAVVYIRLIQGLHLVLSEAGWLIIPSSSFWYAVFYVLVLLFDVVTGIRFFGTAYSQLG